MLNLYPITVSNAPIWLVLMAGAGVALWHLVPVIFRRFVPPGYKYDPEIDALLQECASLSHPADRHIKVLPKSTPKNRKPKKPAPKKGTKAPQKGTAMRKKNGKVPKVSKR